MEDELPVPGALGRAQELVERGDLPGGIRAFEEATELHPEDVRTWLGLGALRHERGEDPLAVDAFARAASIYVRQGQALKAIAVYKQATRIAPMRDDLALELATQYRNQGLASEAVEQLFSALCARASRGESLDCLEVIRTALELDNDNLADRVRLAESYSARGRVAEAMEVFREVLDRMDPEAHAQVYESVARRMAYHGDAPVAVLIDLAHRELSRAAYTQALTLLRRAHQRAPGDTRVLNGVAEAFEGLGQVQPAVVALRHLAEVYSEGGLTEEHAATLTRILALAPDDPWARRALDGVSSMPRESLVLHEHVQSEGGLESTLSAQDAVQVQVSGVDVSDESLVQRFESGLDALFAATAEGASLEPHLEEIATRDIVAIEDADGIEILDTRDILTVELSPEDTALLELDDGSGQGPEIQVLETGEVLRVDRDAADHEALDIEPEDGNR